MGDSTVWEYAWFRATSGGLVMRLDGADVWSGKMHRGVRGLWEAASAPFCTQRRSLH